MLRVKDMQKVEVIPTKDKSQKPYSFSMLDKIATCPTLGMVTYVANRVIRLSARQMAPEAGRAAHDAYAACRLWQVRHHQNLPDHADFHGARLFGKDRYESMIGASMEAGTDFHNAMLRFCLEAFYTSGFYDDPSDTRRTIVNIEESLLAYLNRVDPRCDVYVADINQPEGLLGIELPLDVTISYDTGDNVISVRFVGTADAVMWDKKRTEPHFEDNKTGARLNDAWREAWHTSHQLTGYMIGLHVAYAIMVQKCIVRGMAIPMPRSYDIGGLVDETVRRQPQQFRDFLEWVLYIVQLIEVYGDDPSNAPKFTNACNKYFRACALIPLCASDEDERLEMFNEMIEREPTPTEQALRDVAEGDD